ncbi:T9SS type B sorting domain-containing protein [Algoriphagus marinus]|uniref:T9SS type B sorting domain-containing protein n=1 Tax=Algoriphagus marinus TaxID=1925762 RepID=UPI00094B9F4A|nr:gliding motility-associated C-terminal domain-containing protein [Algoriphagus marinus]
MKSNLNSISFPYIFPLSLIFTFFVIQFSAYSQGFNDNEWIFGYCGTSAENNYLSFGKGGTPTVQTLPSTVLIGKNNNAIAIDPITGQPLFLTNGELVYDYSSNPLQGSAPGLDGDITGRQKVATGFLEYDPDGNKLFYIFYISPGGQLLYSLVDMNAAGQATGNERPLGEVTQKDIAIGTAQGSLLVVKSPSSPSYLITIENNTIISRRLDGTAGSFTTTDTQNIGFTPQAIIFDEASQRLILIHGSDDSDIAVIDFDTSTGTFVTREFIANSNGIEPFGGAEFSPDGAFIYYSRGNKLFRVPSDDLSGEPEEIPLPDNLHAVYDIKVGPDGNLYYIYEEVDGGPQLIGRVTNPNEPDLAEINLEEDPFNGIDFCGTVFPTFAPNADITPTVNFTWAPDMPCANNPIQLTSEITPENYRPVSFEWEFNPPLTDSDGNPLPADFGQEHFLIPGDAAQGQSISVSLTVTFADGESETVSRDITLTENNLEANFTPQDTTLCEGQCVDIAALLEAQSTAGEQGGEAPPSGGDNYEYFWSNFRDEGWGTRTENTVCLPGLYWALVREPGSSCYAYAEIRVQIWDLPDQTNNIWYFGDGAGLDFNPDPNDENAPTPRPIANRHPQNIPAGTTTISDQTGQVLFFTDGNSVWDLNGNLMENGDNIGGDNGSSQGALAVPVPQEETLFYLFTTQVSANGTNEVKFSLVDIKAENQTGVGNVVTKDNFLFSPSTEHTAALDAGDTTWVMFHELGNNTFRAYPVTTNGIGPPVLSSVGSNHGFNSGVGAMKFNSDGDQLAVTISEGGCNKLEIFDFDQSTGELTEYARIDLGCNGEVYGMEFSEDGDRILVSYQNGGPGIEEFIIKSTADEDDPDATACPTCFGTASTRPQIEACILSTRNQISGTSSLNIGALQIGPNGQIYAAVVGDNRIGQINVGTGCTSQSTFTQDGVEPMPGTSNLGLPSFVQNSGSSIPEPSLAAPPRICLDPDNPSGALFEGGGEPDIDSYFWTITAEDGTFLQNNFGGPGEQFQTLEQIFANPGTYTVELRVDRCGDPEYFRASTEILVEAPPTLTLPDAATLCAENPVTLTAIDGYDPAEGLYVFEWTNAAGEVFGDENSNSITVTEESIYTVTVSFALPDGLSEDEAALYETCPATAEIFVGPAFEFDLTQTATEVCYEETSVIFAPNTPITGEWFYELNGDPTRVSLGEFFELELFVNTLPGSGQYEIIFVTQDPILEGCTVEKRLPLLVNELPLLVATQTTPATDCATPDGSFEITMQASASTVTVQETGEIFNNVNQGDVLSVTNLLPGVHTIEALNSTGCSYISTVTVENSNPPSGFEYTVIASDETCSINGVENGTLVIQFTSGTPSGSYLITRQGDGQTFSGSFTNSSQITVNVPYGDYSVEVSDAANCAIPDPTNYTVAQKFEVVFAVPTELTACESFTFLPTSPDNLIYTVTNSSGAIISPDASGEFTISQSGVYIVRGEDPTGVDCPREESITATITQPIVFDVPPPIVDCQAGIRYEVVLINADPADVVFLWRDANRIIVGRSQTFVPNLAGTYSVEVQPRNGGLCPTNEFYFDAEVLTENLEVALDIVPFCVDQTSTTITIDANLSLVQNIEWYSVQGGTRTRIPAFDDLPIIEVSQEGIYEVLLRSAAGCDIGRASGSVAKSIIIPPVVPQNITICAIEGVTESIDPGVYDNYSWKLNGDEVSTSAIFTPTLPGIYELTVSDNLGCFYVENFEVIEDCALKISFPNGVVLNDPNRNFILYANEYIDNVEVYIFNRWGELIFYCEHQNLEPGQPFCPWDGQVGGKFVPNGTYAVKVKFTSQDQNLTQSLIKAITIIQ